MIEIRIENMNSLYESEELCVKLENWLPKGVTLKIFHNDVQVPFREFRGKLEEVQNNADSGSN